MKRPLTRRMRRVAIAAVATVAVVPPAVALASSHLYWDGVLYAGQDTYDTDPPQILTKSHGKPNYHGSWAPAYRTVCVSALYQASLTQVEPVTCSDNSNGFYKDLSYWANRGTQLRGYCRATQGAATDAKCRGEW